jgi:DNA-binding HxlR family transcriptional regulator
MLLFSKRARLQRSASDIEAQDDEGDMCPTPQPGRPVRGSTTGRPLMALLDLLGRRWALRVMWELRDSPLTFRQVQDRCAGMSSSVLNTRLRELREAGIAESADGGYALTDEGRVLLRSFEPIRDWADRWAARTGAG